MLCICRLLVLLAVFSLLPGVFVVNVQARDETPAAASQAEKSPKQRSKKVYTNEDLSDLKNKTRINQSPPGNPSSSRPPGKASGIDGYRDKQGHDREYWQQKMRPLRKRLEALDSQIAAQQTRYNQLNATSGVKVTRSGKMRASSSDTRVQVAKRIEDLNQKRAEVRKSIDELEEEARKSQALPEWLR
ncbi:MAG: hypothetical protein L0338_22990 [Acidobacteria bacterium]|nr:hypothetical protein [Acidobacteriota bacterium]